MAWSEIRPAETWEMDKPGNAASSMTRLAESVGESQQKMKSLVQRAGKQGRGFTIVANEVRKLAERTTKSYLER